MFLKYGDKIGPIGAVIRRIGLGILAQSGGGIDGIGRFSIAIVNRHSKGDEKS